MHVYDTKFFDKFESLSHRAAIEMLPEILRRIKPQSIVDLGCGEGVWLSVVNNINPSIEILGIDGEYVKKEELKISEQFFSAADISKPVKYDKKFDLAISLEVGEHINKVDADQFIDNLVGLADVILFSAAIPGQGGEYHVNEQWQNYWIEKFEAKGYSPDLSVRNFFWNNGKISPWRRQNIILFSRQQLCLFPEVSNIYSVVHPDMFQIKVDKINALQNTNKVVCEEKVITEESLIGKKRIVIFGAGAEGRRIINYLTAPSTYHKDIVIVAVVDNKYTETKELISGYRVNSPECLKNTQFDQVIIGLDDLKKDNEKNIMAIFNQLLKMGVEEEKIVLHNFYAYITYNHSYMIRNSFLANFSERVYEKGIKGAVAECGVWRGHFSATINELFQDRKLYLFDTFESFDQRDVDQESDNTKEWLASQWIVDKLTNTSMKMVEMRCPNRRNVTIVKGYVPDTFEGIEDEFVFVNLDMDLYAPQLAALEYFSSRMVKGGVILLHDYFHEKLFGVKKAVEEFLEVHPECRCMPIGDECSIAIIF